MKERECGRGRASESVCMCKREKETERDATQCSASSELDYLEVQTSKINNQCFFKTFYFGKIIFFNSHSINLSFKQQLIVTTVHKR